MATWARGDSLAGAWRGFRPILPGRRNDAQVPIGGPTRWRGPVGRAPRARRRRTLSGRHRNEPVEIILAQAQDADSAPSVAEHRPEVMGRAVERPTARHSPIAHGRSLRVIPRRPQIVIRSDTDDLLCVLAPTESVTVGGIDLWRRIENRL